MKLRIALPLTLAALVGCSSTTKPTGDGGAAQCTAYQVPAGTDLTKPTVSFKNDVLPIFQGSCGLSTSCHGSNRAPAMNPSAAAGTVRSNVLAASGKLPSMPFVTAGDPSKSFLQHKIDDDQCLFDKDCTGHDCEESMPDDSPPLPVEKRDTIRRWIAQGAADN